jgi:hypothetical protein
VVGEATFQRSENGLHGQRINGGHDGWLARFSGPEAIEGVTQGILRLGEQQRIGYGFGFREEACAAFCLFFALIIRDHLVDFLLNELVAVGAAGEAGEEQHADDVLHGLIAVEARVRPLGLSWRIGSGRGTGWFGTASGCGCRWGLLVVVRIIATTFLVVK